MAVRNRVCGPTQCGITALTPRCTKGGCKLDDGQRMPGAGLSCRRSRKAPLGKPTFQPYWGKPAVRNDREDRGKEQPTRPQSSGVQVPAPPIACLRAVSISDARGGNEPRSARTEKPRLPCGSVRSGRDDLGGEQTWRPEHNEISAAPKSSPARSRFERDSCGKPTHFSIGEGR